MWSKIADPGAGEKTTSYTVGGEVAKGKDEKTHEKVKKNQKRKKKSYRSHRMH